MAAVFKRADEREAESIWLEKILSGAAEVAGPDFVQSILDLIGRDDFVEAQQLLGDPVHLVFRALE